MSRHCSNPRARTGTHPSDYLWWAGNDVADVDGLPKTMSVASPHIGGAGVASCSEEVGTSWLTISVSYIVQYIYRACTLPHPHCWSEYPPAQQKSRCPTYANMSEQPYLPHTAIYIPVIQCCTRTGSTFTRPFTQRYPHIQLQSNYHEFIHAPLPPTKSGPGAIYGALYNILSAEKKESSQHVG